MEVNLTCNNCGKEITNGNMAICSACGTISCGDCSKQSNALCSNCYEKLRYVN